jgi:hypothetical protein
MGFTLLKLRCRSVHCKSDFGRIKDRGICEQLIPYGLLKQDATPSVSCSEYARTCCARARVCVCVCVCVCMCLWEREKRHQEFDVVLPGGFNVGGRHQTAEEILQKLHPSSRSRHILQCSS